MPVLAASLDFAKLEGRNFRAHQIGGAPSSPVSGQVYYDTGNNTLYWYDGSQWVSARGGAAAVPPATTGALGTIQLAGDLAGTATSPQIAAGVITDAEVATANKDGVVGIASMRTLGAGAQQAMPGNRTLNAIAPAAADVDLNGNKLTNLASPTAGSDASTKAYVDNYVTGLDAKASVRCATTGNISLTGTPAVDGITPVGFDRVLVKDQTNPAQNGIYLVNDSGGSWTRASDADTWNEVVSAFVFVETGATNADSGWVCTADPGGSVGTTAMVWTQFSGAGQVVSGAGLTKTGNQLDVGAGAGITVNADSIQVANNGITNAMIADGAINLNSADVTNILPVSKGGTGDNRAASVVWTYWTTGPPSNATSMVITAATHKLAPMRTIQVVVADDTTGVQELTDVTVAANGDVTIGWGATVLANSKQIKLTL